MEGVKDEHLSLANSDLLLEQSQVLEYAPGIFFLTSPKPCGDPMSFWLGREQENSTLSDLGE